MSEHDPDHIPTQAELDAEDLAQLAHSSRDKDEANLYPGRPADPGPAPAALAVHARVAFWGAAAAGVVCLIYGFLNLGTIGDQLRDRMLTDAVATPKGEPSAEQIDTFANVLPIVGLVVLALFLLGEGLFLFATANHHSRSCRSFFLALVALNLLCIPVGLDLFFRYPPLWSGIVILGWLQFGLLVVAAVMSLRRSVNRWLPESTRLRPTRMMRAH